MEPRPKPSNLLHDIQSKCASLKSAAQLLKDCPPEQTREMLALMTDETREILRCLHDMQRELAL